MVKVALTMATWDYDRIQGIKDGSVTVEGCEITEHGNQFRRSMNSAAY